MAKDKGKRFPRLNNLILGIMIGAFFWVLVSLIEILLFHQGNFIQQIFAPDRHELVYRLIVLILFTAFGGYSQYLFSFRRKAEERIQCAYSELEQIFNCSADGICLIDLDYNVLRINKTFSALLKIKQDEAVGRKCYEIFYGPLCHTLNCPLVKILKGEKMVECEMEKKRSDGPPIFNLVILTPFRGPRGDLLGIVKDCRDISEKKRAEEQLREYRFHLEELVQERTKELSVANEQLQQQNATRRQMQEHCTESEIFYRKLFEESSEAVFLTDYETDCIVKANRQAEKMLRRPIKKIIGMNQAHLFSSHEAVSYLQLVKEHLTEMVKQPILAETVTSEGNRVPVEVRSSMIELAGGKKNRQLFFRDITEQKTAEKLLQKHSSDLAQRVRELDCLYSISSLNEQPDISLIEIFQGIVNLIPFVWQYPETLCARICLNDGREFKTVNFRERVVKLSEEIRTRKNSIGMLEVMYLPDKGPSNGGPFSEDQKNLIHVIAEQVGKIIQRNQAETALRESESKLSTMLDSLGDHINMMDRDLNILWANNTAKKFFGEDIIGKKCYQVYHGRKEPCEPYPCIVLKAFMDGKIHKHETQVIFKKGEVTYYHCNANVALRDNEGKPIAVIETCKDITELRKAEEQIKIFKQFADSAEQAFGIATLDGKIIYENPKILQMADKSTLNEVFGKNFIAQYPKVVQKRVEEEIIPLVIKKNQWVGELEYMSHGKIVPTIQNFFVIRDEHNIPKYIAVVMTDISKRKKTEEELIKVMNIKSEFLSMVSHELRTPLTVIKEGISILSDGLLGDINSRQKKVLSVSDSNVDRLARLINDVLDFQKIESGKMTWNIKENDMNEVVKEVCESMLPAIKEKGLLLIVTCDKDVPKVQFDKDKIVQVLINLINNSVKFTEKGAITIETVKAEKTIQITVRDTGIGIRKEDMPKLFESFVQLGEPSERKTGGTGLGLSISKKIILHHGGKIWAESECGKGTIFHFTLPRR